MGRINVDLFLLTAVEGAERSSSRAGYASAAPSRHSAPLRSAPFRVLSSVNDMTEVFSAERIDPGKLSEQQRAALSEKLYQIHRAIFAGLDEEGFDHYVVNSPAKATRILLYRNRQRELIGYFGVHRFEEYLEGQPFTVFRAEVALLPRYRQRDANLSFWLMEAAKFKLLHPGQPVYFLYAPVNPSFYALVARRMRTVYPRADTKLPSYILNLMAHLAQEFGLQRVDERDPLIRKVGWIAKATNREEAFWHMSENPHIRFYVTENPKFREGFGLLMLIPVTVANAVLSLFNFAFHALRKTLIGKSAEEILGQ